MLSHPDNHFLRAAEGWLELGCPMEAVRELDAIHAENQLNPDVLKLRWQIHARGGHWEAALAVAQTITTMTPRISFGWLHLAFSLHELKRTQEAYDTLKPVLERFHDNWLFRYNLACYSCQLGKIDEARHWLEHACALGNEQEVRKLASADKDLAPLQ